MAYPYISGAGNITQMVSQLRKSFPAVITSETVKKLGLAPNNESYVINSLQFIGLIDPEGKRTAAGMKIFSNHKDSDFEEQFGALVKSAYAELFELHGDASWELDEADLVTFFRRSDSTSDTIGRRQAKTFKIFAALSGHGEVVAKVAKPTKSKPIGEVKKTAKARGATSNGAKTRPILESHHLQSPQIEQSGVANIGLTVRVEINLPADGTKDTYDNIFKSIKENLLNG